MKDNKLNLKGGVLIIGSLLWQDHLGTDKKNKDRKTWRDSRLNMRSKIKVMAPIRYGRKDRKEVYTMTFANSCKGKNMGNAFVVPFKNNPIDNLKALLDEALEVSKAEGMRGDFISHGEDGPWSILGILYNKDRIPEDSLNAVRVWWQSQLEKEGNFNNAGFKLGSEKPCILSSGELNIPWVHAVNGKQESRLNNFDFLIATATKHTPPKYPTISNLVKNVIADTDRKYFVNNNKYGIITFQDERIIKRLEK